MFCIRDKAIKQALRSRLRMHYFGSADLVDQELACVTWLRARCTARYNMHIAKLCGADIEHAAAERELQAAGDAPLVPALEHFRVNHGKGAQACLGEPFAAPWPLDPAAFAAHTTQLLVELAEDAYQITSPFRYRMLMRALEGNAAVDYTAYAWVKVTKFAKVLTLLRILYEVADGAVDCMPSRACLETLAARRRAIKSMQVNAGLVLLSMQGRVDASDVRVDAHRAPAVGSPAYEYGWLLDVGTQTLTQSMAVFKRFADTVLTPQRAFHGSAKWAHVYPHLAAYKFAGCVCSAVTPSLFRKRHASDVILFIRERKHKLVLVRQLEGIAGLRRKNCFRATYALDVYLGRVLQRRCASRGLLHGDGVLDAANMYTAAAAEQEPLLGRVAKYRGDRSSADLRREEYFARRCAARLGSFEPVYRMAAKIAKDRRLGAGMKGDAALRHAFARVCLSHVGGANDGKLPCTTDAAETAAKDAPFVFALCHNTLVLCPGQQALLCGNKDGAGEYLGIVLSML